MDVSNRYEAPRSGLSPPDERPLRPQRKRPSRAFIGAMIGPLLGVLFSHARIGPAGYFWWEGYGGEIFLTSLVRTIFVIVLVSGAIIGAFCGRAFDAWSGEWSERTTEIR
jgi:hypothetical protein